MFIVKVILYPQWLDFGENCSTSITFFSCWTVPILLISFRYYLVEFFGINSELLKFSLIQAQNCGVHQLEETLDDSSVNTGIESIYVPAPDIALAKWKAFEFSVSSSLYQWWTYAFKDILFNTFCYILSLFNFSNLIISILLKIMIKYKFTEVWDLCKVLLGSS